MFVTTRSLQRDPVINRIFDVLGSLDGESPETSWVPPVDIFEDAEGIRIIAEVPGVKPEDVKISLEDNVLTIRGSKQQVAQERTERVHRYERHFRAQLYAARDRGRDQHQGVLRARRADRDSSQGGEGQAAADRSAGRVEVTRHQTRTSYRGAGCCAPMY